jgi:predicted peptidase
MIAEKMFFTNGGGFKVPAVKYTLSKMDINKKYPLFIFLHGVGETGNTSTNSVDILFNSSNQANLIKFAEQLGFLVIAPQFVPAYNYSIIGGKVNQTWRPEWAGGNYVNDTIDWAIKNMPIDPARVHLTGLSGGGGGCYDYITTSQSFADKIASCIPICGTELSGIPNWDAARTVPIWAFCGDKDSFYGGNVRQAQKSGAKLTTIPNAGHFIWGGVYDMPELYAWALSNVNDPKIEPVPTDPFKPTHILRHADGTIENVRIETL